jgi:hypothetical protein
VAVDGDDGTDDDDDDDVLIDIAVPGTTNLEKTEKNR